MEEEKDTNMVSSLLKFKASLDTTCEESFAKNGGFRSTIKDTFEHLINLRKNELELKEERRKQSNRESARRYRLRKQAEAEELANKINSLTAEIMTLRSEIDRWAEFAKLMFVGGNGGGNGGGDGGGGGSDGSSGWGGRVFLSLLLLAAAILISLYRVPIVAVCVSIYSGYCKAVGSVDAINSLFDMIANKKLYPILWVAIICLIVPILCCPFWVFWGSEMTRIMARIAYTSGAVGVVVLAFLYGSFGQLWTWGSKVKNLTIKRFRPES